MRTVLRVLWAFASAVLLAACASRPPARVATASAPVPLAPASVATAPSAPTRAPYQSSAPNPAYGYQTYGAYRAYVPYRGFDGAYRAYVVIDAAGPGIDRMWCGTPGPVMLFVTNNRFTLDLRHRMGGAINPTFIVDVAPNGMFQSQASTAIFAGQIVGPSLLGLINGPGCRYTVTATRI